MRAPLSSRAFAADLEIAEKDKKNAKESGGIAAAVTKQAAGKFS